MVGPLPKDVGGTYTTGICKVVYELSKQQYDGVNLYISSTNIPQKKADLICKNKNQYNGYRLLLLDILGDLFMHPLRTYKELRYYKRKCHVNPLRYEFYKVNIRRHIKQVCPDVIHVHTTECVAVSFANYKKIPIIDTMHGVFYRGLESQKNLGDYLTACVEQCDFFTGLTKECEMLMKKYFQIPSSRLAIIPNGVNTSQYFFDKEQREMLRKKYSVDEKKVFITVASVQERKGQFRFLKILEQLGNDFCYWILGEGPDKEVIEEYCKQKGIIDNVKCFGNIMSSELYKYYSAADIYAHASVMEGQALCEMEAYASGLRIIVNQEIKDTIATNVNDQNIYYVLNFENIDNQSLTEWISRPVVDRQSRRDMSWSKIAQKYGKVYHEVKAQRFNS